MKKIFLILVLFTAITSKAQQAENIIIITTDGFRWQAFKGMDETLAQRQKIQPNGQRLHL
jgi:hypothetical protein